MWILTAENVKTIMFGDCRSVIHIDELLDSFDAEQIFPFGKQKSGNSQQSNGF